MSIFQSFQTGLAIGQEQRKQRDIETARKGAADAYKAGNFEGATTGLMAAGLYDEADAYARAGDRTKAEARRTKYGDAFKSGSWTGLGEVAAGEGDFETVGYAQGQARGLTMQEWEDRDRAITEQKQGMEFLATSAANLRSLPLEARGQAAMDAIASSPFANDPAVMQAVQQAAADGRITDDELSQFEQQMLTAAQRLEAERWDKSFKREGEWHGDEVAHRNSQANANKMRPATPQELARYNLPANAPYQVDGNGQLYLIDGAGGDGAGRKYEKDAQGVLRYIDNGEEVFPGVGGPTETPKPLIGSEAMARVAAGLPNAKGAVQGLETLTFNSKATLLTVEGYDPASDWGAAVIEAIPDWGLLKGLARWTGGEDYQMFKDSYGAFEAGMLPIISGAAITDTEAKRQMQALQIKPGDSKQTKRRKLDLMAQMVEGVELAARGDTQGFLGVLDQVGQQSGAGPVKRSTGQATGFEDAPDEDLFLILRAE